jgi:formylglycine-generating enzyme required for sulfatase activity
MSIRRGIRYALLAGACVLATGCLTGRDAPEPTAMVPVTQGLTFVFGDDQICQSASVNPQQLVTCADIHEDGKSAGLIAKVYPTVTVTVPAFEIDAHEVTNIQYEYCVAAGGCTTPAFTNAQNIADYFYNPRFADYPVVNVSWEQARAYCAFVSKRLPTQFEWERVAGGPATTMAEKRRYPVQDNPATPDDESQDIRLCRGKDIALFYCGASQDPQRAGTSAYDQISEGGRPVYGLLGNVSEWILDYNVPDFTCESLPSCRDCWTCPSGDESCYQNCYLCPECRDSTDPSCFILCPADDPSMTLGYPVCFEYPQDLFCRVNAQGLSECCVGGADSGDCFVKEPPDRRRAFRGGSYLTRDSQTCSTRSGDRSQGIDQTEELNRLGFRCARTL